MCLLTAAAVAAAVAGKELLHAIGRNRSSCLRIANDMKRTVIVLTVFLKHGQMDFSKAFNSISHHLTPIFPENVNVFGWVE